MIKNKMMFLDLHDFIAGCIGGIGGLIVGHPGDTIKVRQQTYNSALWVAIKKTYTHEGIHGFFKGMLFPLLTIGPSNSIFFGVYGNSLHIMHGSAGTRVNFEDPMWQQKVFLAVRSSGSKGYIRQFSNIMHANMIFIGRNYQSKSSAKFKRCQVRCLGGIATVLATCPVELVKTVLQANTEQKGNWNKPVYVRETRMLGLLKAIYKQGGIPGLYRGLVPMLYRDVPTFGIYTWAYEFLTHYIFHANIFGEIGRQILAGGSAGVISWMFIIPLDVVKSRIQADNPLKPMYKGMIDCFYKSYKSDGMAVFHKGFLVICLRAFPVNAATFVGYETALKVLKEYF